MTPIFHLSNHHKQALLYWKALTRRSAQLAFELPTFQYRVFKGYTFIHPTQTHVAAHIHPFIMTDAASRWKTTVYVGGLAPIVTSTHIHDAFIPFGEIADVSIPKNDKPDATEPHRGFAYVEFEDAEDAKEAIDNMDQAELFGRILKVSAAKPPKSAEGGLNSKTAVWEQVRCVHSSAHMRFTCDAFNGANIVCRRAGLPSMLLVRRTRWPPSQRRPPLASIQCKVWRDWTLRVPSPSDVLITLRLHEWFA